MCSSDLVPMLEIAAHIRRGLRGIARAAEVRHELGIGIHRAHGVEMLGAQPLSAQARGYEGIGEQRQGLATGNGGFDSRTRMIRAKITYDESAAMAADLSEAGGGPKAR